MNENENDQGQNPGQTPPAGTPPVPPAPIEPTKAPERVVPEKYELKLPEGSPLAPDAVEKVAEFAKAKKLTLDEAQAVLERESAVFATYVEKVKSDQEAVLETERASWVEKLKTDKEIGGTELQKNVELAKRVISRYDTEGELRKALDATGLGNYPELVRIFVRIGKEMSDDQFVLPGAKPPEKMSMADRLYPNSVKTQ